MSDPSWLTDWRNARKFRSSVHDGRLLILPSKHYERTLYSHRPLAKKGLEFLSIYLLSIYHLKRNVFLSFMDTNWWICNIWRTMFSPVGGDLHLHLHEGFNLSHLCGDFQDFASWINQEKFRKITIYMQTYIWLWFQTKCRWHLQVRPMVFVVSCSFYLVKCSCWWITCRTYWNNYSSLTFVFKKKIEKKKKRWRVFISDMWCYSSNTVFGGGGWCNVSLMSTCCRWTRCLFSMASTCACFVPFASMFLHFPSLSHGVYRWVPNWSLIITRWPQNMLNMVLGYVGVIWLLRFSCSPTSTN